jgi:glutamine synthetase
MPYNTEFTKHTELSFDVLEYYRKLDPKGKIIAEYIWIGGSGQDLRCKSRTLSAKVGGYRPQDLPKWNFDGSSTGQAPGEDSEVILYPQAVYADPFRGGDNIMVLCDCYKPDGTPIANNTRKDAAEAMEKVIKEVPWFGIEQEYTLFEADGKTPFGWPKGAEPGAQGPYYCSVGTENAYGRAIMEAHYHACLFAGLTIGGTNGEVMPGQWEYQIGPCTGIESGDELWISRYILQRVCEQFGVIVSLDPKPIEGDWNGAGCHTNYSTQAMRQHGGFAVIVEAIEKLGKRHKEHMIAYGEGNERRLTGRHETAAMDKFSYGVANRGASIRIGRQTEADGCGYFEDRRPASNMDPYVVTGMIVKTTLLNE